MCYFQSKFLKKGVKIHTSDKKGGAYYYIIDFYSVFAFTFFNCHVYIIWPLN